MENIKSLEYKTYELGNFFIRKFKSEYTDDMKNNSPETGIPAIVHEIAKKEGFIPYIEFGDKNGMILYRWIVGCEMYLFIDTLETVDGDFTEDEKKFLDVWCNVLYANAALVGDNDYWKSIMKAQADLVDRLVNSNNDES